MGGQGELRLWAWRWRPDPVPVPVPVPCREQPGGSCARPHPHRERTRALSTPRLSALPRSLAPTMPGSHGGRRAASTCLSCPPDPGSPLPPASFYLWLPHGTPVHTPSHECAHEAPPLPCSTPSHPETVPHVPGQPCSRPKSTVGRGGLDRSPGHFKPRVYATRSGVYATCSTLARGTLEGVGSVTGSSSSWQPPALSPRQAELPKCSWPLHFRSLGEAPRPGGAALCTTRDPTRDSGSGDGSPWKTVSLQMARDSALQQL